MTCQPAINFEDLPATIPIFPLAGVLLLPRGRLPLNIFEPRYLAMVDDAMRGDRLIGMIQPSSNTDKPPVFSTGCVGRIVSYDESEDGRYLITLAGICRFCVVEELPSLRGYRRVAIDCGKFKGDMQEDCCPKLDRDRFVALLRSYFAQQELSANWEAIESTPDERLLTSLAMICPFEPREKQALLEAPTLPERARIMMALLEMAIVQSGPGTPRH